MSEKIDFEAVKRIGYAMTVDIWAFIAEGLISILYFPGQSTVFGYIKSTVPAVQIICRIQILASLFRLNELNTDYRKAQIMYAAHIILSAVSSGVAGLLFAKADYTKNTTIFPYLILVLLTCADGVAHGLGDMAVLRGTAAILKGFGLMKRAAKNIRAGTVRFVMTALIAVSDSVFAVMIFIYNIRTGFLDIISQGESNLERILIFLAVFSYVCTLVSCLIAAGGMRRSYKEIKELTK